MTSDDNAHEASLRQRRPTTTAQNSATRNGTTSPSARVHSDHNNDASESVSHTADHYQHVYPEATEPHVHDGRTLGGTGRLPRDAPFTPAYVNAYTANSLIALISFIVTATFFYFKIIRGLLEAPQLGLGRESMYLMNGGGGPMDAGDPREMLTPVCPSPTDMSRHMKNMDPQQQQDGCELFGKIVVLADTISKYGYSHATHGWVASLADEWSGKADVVLRSFPGYNTHWIRSIFPDLLHQESVSSSTTTIKLVVVALGTDDAAFPHTRQHIAPDQYKENLRSIVTSIKYPATPNYAPDTQVVLVTPAPVDDIVWGASLAAIGQPLDHSNNVTQEYATACVQVGEELHVPVVDLWSDVSCQIDGSCDLHESTVLSDYLMDGLHLRRMGNDVLFRGVLNAVAHHYPQLHPVCWPSVFPGYSEQSPDTTSLKKHCP
ncbi:hypothetical protein BG004_002864 [Podila humilis]|nr:hypothetical protein BG004_002864 [Podila humilis]